MKKIILLIIGVLIIVPSIVFADMGAPATDSYKATVTNPDGAKDENGKVILKYGETITVDYEQDGMAYFKDGEVSVKDITAIEKNYTLKDKEWTKSDVGIVLKKIELKKGPAAAYEGTGITIEPYTTVTIRTQILEGGSSWVYVEYNGKKGFVDSLGGTITVGEGDAMLVAYTDTDILDPVTDKKIGTLKANSVIVGKYHYLDMWSNY